MNPSETPPVMNMSHPAQYYTPGPTSTPQHHGQYGAPSTHQLHYTMPPPPTQQQTTTNQPPAWALGIIDDIKTIKLTVPKIDKIENTVVMINQKIAEIDTRVCNLETKLNDVERSCNFISDQSDQHKIELDRTKTELARCQQTCKEMKNSLQKQQEQNEITGDKITDLESRSMRDNLIFYGIPELNPEENCEELVKQFIQKHLDINTDDIQMDHLG